MATIQQYPEFWRITGGNMILDLDRGTGCPVRMEVQGGNQVVWLDEQADILIRDDLLRKTFDCRDIVDAHFAQQDEILSLERRFSGAPWVLRESYRVEKGAIRWEAEVVLDEGEFRSCCITYQIPLPTPIYPLTVWCAREGMPTHVHSHHLLTMEYAEVNGGVMLPAVQVYVPGTGMSFWGETKADAGLMMAMPFDFATPRLSFTTSYREEYLAAHFDWMALSPQRSAQACLLLRGIGGDWRPGLGWLYERFQEYFVPRSTMIHQLWGGHFGTCDRHITLEQAKTAATLGARWCELHEHFAGYGDYVPETEVWRTCHNTTTPPITQEIIHNYIATIKAAGVAALPYLQVSGDGDVNTIAARFEESQMHDIRGRQLSSWPGTWMMNSDPSLPFGKHIEYTIDEFMQRYPELDGIFLDQASYNFQDMRHDDGISAYNNKPCYMSGFNFEPHLQHLSQLLHPHKTLISNAAYSVGQMKYIDGFMNEGIWTGCDRFQYWALAKPMYFLMGTPQAHHIELMLQQCVLYACSPTNHHDSHPFSHLFSAYMPMIEKLNRRNWVFDPAPFRVPEGFKGGIFRGENGNLLFTMQSQAGLTASRKFPTFDVQVRTKDIAGVSQMTLHLPGEPPADLPFTQDNHGAQFSLPRNACSALVEMHLQ